MPVADKTRSSVAVALFISATLLSILSQIPGIVESGMDFYLKLTWIAPFGWMLFKHPGEFLSRRLRFFYIPTAVFAAYCLTMQHATGDRFVGLDLYNIFIALFLTSTSYVFARNYMSESIMRHLAIAIMGAAAAVGVYECAVYFPEVNYSLLTNGYPFRNSVAFILLSALLFGIFTREEGSRRRQVWIWILAAILSVCIFMLRSRAVYLCFLFSTVYFITTLREKRKRILAACIILALSLAVIIIGPLRDFVINRMLFASRPIDDPDLFFSRRLSLIGLQLSTMGSNHWIAGKGCEYLDCFPIAAIIQYGIIGGGILISLVCRVGVMTMRPSGTIGRIAFSLFWIGAINCLFEASAPFGPGVKCMQIWIAFGFLIAMKRTEKR